jgi:hypothetical protein
MELGGNLIAEISDYQNYLQLKPIFLLPNNEKCQKIVPPSATGH